MITAAGRSESFLHARATACQSLDFSKKSLIFDFDPVPLFEYLISIQERVRVNLFVSIHPRDASNAFVVVALCGSPTFSDTVQPGSH